MKHKVINIIFFSDTHLGFDYPLRPRAEKPHRGEDFFKNFERVLSYATVNKIDLVIHGGDLFFRSKVPNPIVDRVYQTLSAFANHGIPVFIVPGNHERSSLPTSLFLNHPLIYIFDKPRSFSLPINDVRIVICGFPSVRGNVRGKFQSIIHQSGWTNEFPNIKILVFHQAIESATVGPNNFTFRNSEDVVRLSQLPEDASVVLCGHIHRRQRLAVSLKGGGRSIPIIFSGSTERTSFAEKDEEKGFYHLVFIQNNEKNWRLYKARFISLPSHPMRDIYIDNEVELQEFDLYLQRMVSQIAQNSIIRFRSYRPLRKEIIELMTTKNLRQILPPEIDFKLTSDIYKGQ